HEAIPAAFESEHYRNSVAEIDQELEDRHRSALETLQQEARRENVSLIRTPHGFAIAPIRNGEILSDAQFEKLPAEEQEQTRRAITPAGARTCSRTRPCSARPSCRWAHRRCPSPFPACAAPRGMTPRCAATP